MKAPNTLQFELERLQEICNRIKRRPDVSDYERGFYDGQLDILRRFAKGMEEEELPHETPPRP